MINFKNIETQVKTYVESHLPAYITQMTLPAIDVYVDDFLDFDKYKQNNAVFYNFSNWTFSDLTNDSDSTTLRMSIYFVCRNQENLRSLLLNYATAFYKCFQDSGETFGGLFDFGNITECDFYNAAEGNKNLKVCEINLTFELEI